MDIDATVETSHNRRQINLQIETPEAGRVIGYHGKVLKSLQLLSQISYMTVIQRIFLSF